MKTTLVTVSDTTPTLIAKGPGRVRLAVPAGIPGYALLIGDSSITQSVGYPMTPNSDSELALSLGEKLYGLTSVASGAPGPVDYVVMLYGLP